MATGLHGHRIGAALLHSAVAELAGTFILVLGIITTAILLPFPVVPFAGAAALLIGVAAFGPVSGAHFNPAVTVALAVTGRFPWRQVPLYVVAQFAGALLAALAAWGVEGSRTHGALGATAPATGVSGPRVLLVEALVTFILVLVIVAVATDRTVPRAGAALAIGTALGVAILISGPITGAGVNPARALGPMLIAGRLTDWWAYIVGPLIGGIAGAALWSLMPATPAPAVMATADATARS
ncbi:aquaporin [Actinoplanes sp. NPDC048796]|uniref:MIP/aquaporin family protein n=1 Tax=unclassified Actinoplanes TaxID=2626549 RepID=UPI003400247A